MRTIKKVSHWDFHPHVRSGNERTLGEKAADGMRTAIGSWTFFLGFGFAMTIWIFENGFGFDPVPFFKLNLTLSMIAGLQGSVLLIAAKRADRIAAELAEYHLKVSEDHKKMLKELSDLLENKLT